MLFDQLKISAKEENILYSISDQLKIIRSQMIIEKGNSIKQSKDQIVDLIESEIVSRYYFEAGKVVQQLKNDHEVAEAIKLLKDKERYASILK